MPCWGGLVEDTAPLLAQASGFPAPQEYAGIDKGSKKAGSDDGADDDSSNSTTGQTVRATRRAVVGRGCGRRRGNESHVRGDGRELDAGASTFGVRVITAGVGRVDAARGTIATETKGAVAIATILRLVSNAGNAILGGE